MVVLIALAVVYVIGYVGCVIALDPRDSFEGGIVILTSVVWPIHALGWLVSRRSRW